MKYLVTFMSSGGVFVEAESEDEAITIFNKEFQEIAKQELVINGIDITDIQEYKNFDCNWNCFCCDRICADRKGTYCPL